MADAFVVGILCLVLGFSMGYGLYNTIRPQAVPYLCIADISLSNTGSMTTFTTVETIQYTATFNVALPSIMDPIKSFISFASNMLAENKQLTLEGHGSGTTYWTILGTANTKAIAGSNNTGTASFSFQLTTPDIYTLKVVFAGSNLIKESTSPEVTIAVT